MYILDMFSKKMKLPGHEEALPGRAEPIDTAETHFVNGHPLKPPFPDGLETAIFGMGCFWGVERKFWQLPGVHVTAAGYSGGATPNPTYQEVCTGQTGQNEVVLVVFDPAVITYERLLATFWEGHDPTQGMRQGNDMGTQYRSAIYTSSQAQADAAEASKLAYQQALAKAGHKGTITTEIEPASEFYYAEAYHQQYLAKNPSGYCGVGGTGISCPIGLKTEAAE
ncbi:peptide-methionine (S)-S-oxide reductase MsrA [Aurantimonas marianensis]|uniref:Peptide methionine sulfoxide reductase MsrA n=1 Tax=Aurantimonas marianensis TaxID=2920428 RepID=A0A9X2HBQ8_9HYPH|nr:peptide-methionine (S)-S-oxide reductase MsrA [Aurantimonas marianensis]MCP3056975.1 peptide-methionine (S)-S-oxide reductase MsrA [Aurantimonas marianensis]